MKTAIFNIKLIKWLVTLKNFMIIQFYKENVGIFKWVMSEFKSVNYFLANLTLLVGGRMAGKLYKLLILLVTQSISFFWAIQCWLGVAIVMDLLGVS